MRCSRQEQVSCRSLTELNLSQFAIPREAGPCAASAESFGMRGQGASFSVGRTLPSVSGSLVMERPLFNGVVGLGAGDAAGAPQQWQRSADMQTADGTRGSDSSDDDASPRRLRRLPSYCNSRTSSPRISSPVPPLSCDLSGICIHQAASSASSTTSSPRAQPSPLSVALPLHAARKAPTE